jgi:hypothetical protein
MMVAEHAAQQRLGFFASTLLTVDKYHFLTVNIA